MTDGDRHHTTTGDIDAGRAACASAGSRPDPVADVAVALAALGRLEAWFRRGAGEAEADGVAEVIAGLGHIDALAKAARIRAITAAEDLALAERDGAASTVEWLAGHRTGVQTCRLLMTGWVAPPSPTRCPRGCRAR